MKENQTQPTEATADSQPKPPWLARFGKAAARQIEATRRRNEEPRVMARAIELIEQYPVLSPAGAVQMATQERGRAR